MSVCICFIVVAFYVSFIFFFFFFFFSSRRRHTRSLCDWSSDVCSSDLTSINHLEDRASSTYHAFQVSGRRQEIGRASCKGKSVDLGGRRIIKKKKKKKKKKK